MSQKRNANKKARILNLVFVNATELPSSPIFRDANIPSEEASNNLQEKLERKLKLKYMV